MMKSKSPSKKWRQGIYNPINTNKYKGDSFPIFRSAWEARMMRFLDLNENVIEWVSEQPLVPYLNPNTNTVWNYHPDFVIKIKSSNGIKIQMIEIKPKKQTMPPVMTESKRKNTFIKEMMAWNMNVAKWKNAKEYCKQKGWEFIILTEDQLFG